jgi:hypothetical protein
MYPGGNFGVERFQNPDIFASVNLVCTLAFRIDVYKFDSGRASRYIRGSEKKRKICL